MFAMTHNSCAVSKTALPPLAANQGEGFTIDQQLAAGYRAFELDLWNVGNSVHCCHGGCKAPFLDGGALSNILSIFSNFLVGNPNDIVTIFVQNEANLTVSRLNDLFAPLKQFLYSSNSTTEWPTLKEMIQKNQRVVLMTSRPLGSDFPMILNEKQHSTMNNYRAFSTSDFQCEAYDPKGIRRTLTRLNHFLSIDLDSRNDWYLPDFQSKEITNSESSLQAHLDTCTKEGIFVNFLTVDWGNAGNVMQVVRRYNGLSTPPPNISPAQSFPNPWYLVAFMLVLLFNY